MSNVSKFGEANVGRKGFKYKPWPYNSGFRDGWASPTTLEFAFAPNVIVDFQWVRGE